MMAVPMLTPPTMPSTMATINGLELSYAQGNEVPITMALNEFPAAIGRDESSALVLTGLWVGRRHAELRLGRAGLMVIDQGTLAGTLINGQRISEYGPLQAGDLIQIGAWSLRVERLIGDAEIDHEVASIDQQLITRAVVRLRELIDLRKKDWQRVSDEVVRHECHDLLIPIVEELMPAANPDAREDFIAQVIAESVGFGPLERLFADPEISEIMVNAHDQIFIERHGICEQTGLRFVSEDSVRAVIDRIVSPLGRRIDDASPMVDARLADGSRVNAVIRPLAVKGSNITIRRFSSKRLGPHDLIDKGSVTGAMLRFLELVVKHRCNVIVAGGTGSGKTTLLNLLSQWIPSHERLITIEDAAELRLTHGNLVSLEVRQPNAEGNGLVSIRDLLRNLLRMRPDRIIVGECRGGEALDMLQAMNTGHEGSLTTIHANSPRDALSRLEVMVMMAGFELPLGAIREQIASAVDILIQQQRCSDGHRRVVSISEVTGVESGVIQTQEIFCWRQDQSQFMATGIIPNCLDRMARQGVRIDSEQVLGLTGAF